jgi:hypothetical protein
MPITELLRLRKRNEAAVDPWQDQTMDRADGVPERRRRAVMTTEAGAPDSPRVWRGKDGLHVDVRGLPCPEPLVAVLRLIDGGAAVDVLIAHLSQEPLLLYSELEERGWRHRLLPSSGVDHVVVEIVRACP